MAGGPRRRPARRRPVPDGRAGEGGRRRRRPGLGRRRASSAPGRSTRSTATAGVLERHYPSMVRFVEFCRKRSTPELLPPRQFHCFGDWLSINADTPKDVIYTAYFAHSTLADGPGRRGAGQDGGRGQVLGNCSTRSETAFIRAYVAADGRIKGNTQAVLRAGPRLRLSSRISRRRPVDGKTSSGRPSTSSRTSRSAAGTSPPASSAPSR